MNLQDQILELAPLMSQTQIAVKLNVSEGYVSQILAKKEYSAKVIEKKLELLDEATERDNKWNKLEDMLLEKMEDQVPNIFKPQDILRALLSVNKAQRRGATAQDLSSIRDTANEHIVQLVLPESIKTKFTLSSEKEVTEVNGRPLISQDSRVLYQQALQEKENAKQLSFSKTDVDLEI